MTLPTRLAELRAMIVGDKSPCLYDCARLIDAVEAALAEVEHRRTIMDAIARSMPLITSIDECGKILCDIAGNTDAAIARLGGGE